MIITTARKPSPKTRSFCKHLGLFTGWEYVNRGKASLSEFAYEPFLLVGEYKGNPGSFKFFINDRCLVSIRANVSLKKEIVSGAEPIFQGNSPLISILSRITGLKIGEESQRIIRVNNNIEFICDGEPLIILKVLELREMGNV